MFDCWFESGSMPYAQCHYPFDNKEQFERGFPADFIAEVSSPAARASHAHGLGGGLRGQVGVGLDARKR